MNTMNLASTNETIQNEIPADSLLDHLYTYFTLNQLNELHDSEPDAETLAVWTMSAEEYKSQVRLAIEYVTHD